MCPKQQILTLAELCGWVVTTKDHIFISPEGHEWQVMYGWQTYKDGSDILPQYPFNHDDINFAIDFLLEGNAQREMIYCYNLVHICCGEGAVWADLTTAQRMAVMLAAPAQKCKALLKTLNKWEEIV